MQNRKMNLAIRIPLIVVLKVLAFESSAFVVVDLNNFLLFPILTVGCRSRGAQKWSPSTLVQAPPTHPSSTFLDLQ